MGLAPTGAGKLLSVVVPWILGWPADGGMVVVDPKGEAAAITARSPEVKRKAKPCLVDKGQAHAALVFDGENCIGWCQFGSPAELHRIHNERAYLVTKPTLHDWRITCFFVGKGCRGKGVASAALAGALEQIGKLGGGRVEGYPEDIEGRKAPRAFLFNGALSMFEQRGFERSRKIGKHKRGATRAVEYSSGAVASAIFAISSTGRLC